MLVIRQRLYFQPATYNGSWVNSQDPNTLSGSVIQSGADGMKLGGIVGGIAGGVMAGMSGADPLSIAAGVGKGALVGGAAGIGTGAAVGAVGHMIGPGY